MKQHVSNLLMGAIVAGLAGCAATPQQTDNTTSTAKAVVENKNVSQPHQSEESAKLNTLVDQYFDEYVARNPLMATFIGIHDYDDEFNAPLSKVNLAQEKAFLQKYRNALQDVDVTALSGQDWLTYRIFNYDLNHRLAGFAYPEEYLPLSQMGGVHSYFAVMGSGQSVQPFKTAEDYSNFISRAKGFARFMDSTITYMRRGIGKGVVLPTPIAEKVLPQLSAHVVDDVTQSVFYGPVTMLEANEALSERQKAKIKQDYISMIKEVIIPAYQRVYHFMDKEYLPATRQTVGLSALPDGKQWYEYKIETHTTLPLTADEIHEFGQQEVKRILNEMRKVKEEVDFDGDLTAFFNHLRTSDEFYFDSEDALIAGYTRIKQKIDKRLPQLFSVFPQADYVVKAVEPFRAASEAGASYLPPSQDGSRPGVFYVNTHNLKAQPKFLMETLSIHEAAPGHHFQIAIQQEVEDLPEFRKFNSYTVFAEGWALYAESLGKELGLFTDPYMWYGRLSDEQLRAMRLVVDTGLHAKGWTRQQAIDFMLKNSSMAESDVVAEVERYISMPGQALAYKVGQRHIRQLREHASQALGDKFDLREFHRQILIDGAMPMPILSEKIDRWISSQQ